MLPDADLEAVVVIVQPLRIVSVVLFVVASTSRFELDGAEKVSQHI